jgi:hypothetical protein
VAARPASVGTRAGAATVRGRGAAAAPRRRARAGGRQRSASGRGARGAHPRRARRARRPARPRAAWWRVGRGAARCSRAAPPPTLAGESGARRQRSARRGGGAGRGVGEPRAEWSRPWSALASDAPAGPGHRARAELGAWRFQRRAARAVPVVTPDPRSETLRGVARGQIHWIPGSAAVCCCLLAAPHRCRRPVPRQIADCWSVARRARPAMRAAPGS